MLSSCVKVCSASGRGWSYGWRGAVRQFSVAQFEAVNEPVLDYDTGSKERIALEAKLEQYGKSCMDIPIVIGDEEIHTADTKYQCMPFSHRSQIAKFSYATPELLKKSIDNSLAARKDWVRTPFEKRAEIFHRAADLIASKYRADIVATTMLGQAKTIVQGEIDAACELIDFLNYNIFFGQKLMSYQPVSVAGTANSMEYRGMEGFWASISPFNFTAIGGNLSSAPALAGNVVQWKPSDTSMLSNYLVYKIFREAGLPPGIINFVPSDGPAFGNTITSSPDLAGINFTGSVPTFEHLWRQVGTGISNFKGFPRMIGECGGKNFHLVHPSADMESVAIGTVRSAFEYSGQKCSACSRLFVPKAMWPGLKDRMVEISKQIQVGSPLEAKNFLSAVIDDKSFSRNKNYLDHAHSSGDLRVISGGTADQSEGYYVQPTIIESSTPTDKIMTEEIFGPILTVYAYDEKDIGSLLGTIDQSTPYALTGAIYAGDESVLDEWKDYFRDSAGNFYVNDKSTGSVVGQQPFGGTRKSGTNDKAGGPHYMMRFLSPRSVKTTSVPAREWSYSYMK